jgi:hypothetical protein
MRYLWAIPVLIIFLGMKREWDRLNAPKKGADIIKELRSEIKDRRNKRRQEWEWRHAV